MGDNIDIDTETMLELMRYAFLRLDGAWFIASAEKFGIEAATDLDIKAWEKYSERLGKRIATIIGLNGDFSKDLPKLMKVNDSLMKMNTELTIEGGNKAIHKVFDCEIWKMVQKVWSQDEIPCHKVTLASIKGLLKGAFPQKDFTLKQNKKIPLGDPFCEIQITLNNPD
ncbi:MAG: DUF6125 family protein [Promethearchaeota archaeon]